MVISENMHTSVHTHTHTYTLYAKMTDGVVIQFNTNH